MTESVMEMQQTGSMGQVKRALHPYWQKVRRVRAQLKDRLKMNFDVNEAIPAYLPWVFVTAFTDGEASIDGSERVPIRTFECPLETAAQGIAQLTHRLATPEEKEAFLADRKEREEYCRRENERVNPELAAQRFTGQTVENLARLADAFARNVPNGPTAPANVPAENADTGTGPRGKSNGR